MRNVSSAALAQLTSNSGTEPVNLLQIYWTDTNIIWYADRTISRDIRGKILEMSAFDDVVNFSGGGSTQTFNVTLDDVDGSIKNIYNYNDIHKAKVKVYQWFTGISLDDAFLIFEGQINSPIVWKEGERTISFAIVSQLEDQEVGFSPEEGLFDAIPDDMIGKPWPLPFGTCLLVPVHKLDPIPTGILLDTTASVDPTIDAQIAALTMKILELYNLARISFYLAVEAFHNGSAEGELGIDDYWEGIGQGYLKQGSDYLVQAAQAQQEAQNLVRVKLEQGKYQRSSLRVHNGDCFPQNTSGSATLANGSVVSGQMNGSSFQVDSTRHPGDTQGTSSVTQVPITTSIQTGGTQQVIQKLGFVWEPMDQPFKLSGDIPIKYLCCMLQCQVMNLWAYRNYNDARILMQVPPEYYSVNYVTYGSLVTTQITLHRPLSYYDAKWDDSLFADLVSPVGPNTVDILTWLIQNYTTKSIDSTSFNYVRSVLNPFPSNFCLLKQDNIIKVLGDIAYQSRCALTLKNEVFYLQFLPEEPDPVDEITEADILVNTLEIDHTPTESIITKLVADYVITYEGGRTNKIIIRNNTLKYGIHEQTTNWYIYTAPALVDLAASFWAIRKSNTWKLLRFRTPLHKIRLETFDAVTINLTAKWASTESVTGIIQSVKLDTKELNLEFEVWIPVRLGEMTKYDFAWPADSIVQTGISNLEFAKPGSDATGDLGPTNGASICAPHKTMSRSRKRQRISYPTTENPASLDTSVALAPQSDALDTTPQPNIPYSYNQHSAAPIVVDNVKQGSFPGIVTDASNAPVYKVLTYLRGLNEQGSTTEVRDVTSGATIPVNTWVTVLVVVWTKKIAGRDKLFSDRYMIPSATRNVYMGKIVSHSSGSNYLVDLYTQGVDKEATDTVTVTQLQIDSESTIPTDSWVVVVLNQRRNDDGTTSPEYTMQFPVYV